MIKETQLKYKNVTTECIMIYLNLCTSCLKKSKVAKKGLVVKPMVFKEMNYRAQVDMIDMQSQPDGDYKWILVYQDHLTKFVQIRPTKSKQATEVAYNLLDTFCTFGAPSVLQSDNGREFSNSVIEELKDMWDKLKIVHGKPRHSQSQGSVERANRDIEDMLSMWMDSNSTDKWADGLRFVQCMKNQAYHEGLKCSPYEAMFGQPMKVGLKTSNLPDEAVESLQTEEDLDILINSITSVKKEGEEIQQEGTREDEVSIDEVELERREEGESERREEEEIARRGEVEVERLEEEEIVRRGEVELERLEEEEIVRRGEVELKRSNGVEIERREEVELEIREEVEFEVEEREGMEEEQGEAPPRAQNENVLEMVAGDIGNEDPDDQLSLSPTLCKRRENIHEKRKMAVENLQAQASKMTKFSLDKFPPGKVGDTVRVRVPDVDRGRCDLRNILGVVTHVNHDNKTYKIGTQFGRINSSYARNQFTTCKEKLMQLENVPDMEISLCEYASKLSLSGGQRYKRCSCKTQCSSNRCTCRKSGKICNSKCHGSLSCPNK